ncbi:alpha-galactosidase [Tamlana fucoidanivorans]|nr:alpha-galactosidase [Tamlana fucoidanivorans]
MLLLINIVYSSTYSGSDRYMDKVNEIALDNNYIQRKVGVVSGVLKTISIYNKIAGKHIFPESADEFELRISKDASKPTKDITLKSKDFEVINFTGTENEIVAELQNKTYQINVKVYYTLDPNDFYGHKFLKITSKDEYVIEVLDIESISLKDAYEPYRAKNLMWTKTKFLPNLGQPVYTSRSATFWGVEFPASWNRIENENDIHCGYQAAVELKPNKTYTSYKAVFGVGDDSEYIKDSFLKYIDEIRLIPFDLHVQYNSWFDFSASITQKKFLGSLETLNNELVIKRGCKPIDVYVVDDGWQNSRPNRSPLEDWSKGMYGVNTLVFDEDMKTVKDEIEKKGSKMGLWASPACLFGATANLDVLEKNGLETLVGSPHRRTGKVAKSMSMVGEKYMELLEEALLRMVDMGAVYFKLDGIFGHMGARFFEVVPNRGTPVMTHLLPKDIVADDVRLNDEKFDEMKRYYITRGTERLIKIYEKMIALNPKVRILNHNGATISPWWLMTTDVISLVNQQDGAQGGSDRNAQMVYRDGIYYQTVKTDGNQIPINSIFNHEPAKDGGDRFDDANFEDFRNYFFMNLARGTAMVELYVQVRSLDKSDYDVIADGLKWLYKAYPAFKRSRMHGYNPLGENTFDEINVNLKNINIDKDTNVYGYTGWNENQGFVSIHNPTLETKTYSFKLDRKFGLLPNTNGQLVFDLSSPMQEKITGLKKEWRYGETVTLKINPKDVIILDFNKK